MGIAIKTVQMKNGKVQLRFDSPYHPDLPAKLRALGGKWSNDNRAWYLPVDVERALRQLCVDVFGIDPLAVEPADLVNAEIEITGFDSSDQTFFAFGRALLNRPGRDSDVRPGEGVSILRGGFHGRGGSARYPALGEAQGETVLLVRDIPRAMLEQFQANTEYAVTIVDRPTSDNTALVQAKEMAVQLAQRMLSLTAEQQQEVISILEAAMEKRG